MRVKGGGRLIPISIRFDVYLSLKMLFFAFALQQALAVDGDPVDERAMAASSIY